MTDMFTAGRFTSAALQQLGKVAGHEEEQKDEEERSEGQSDEEISWRRRGRSYVRKGFVLSTLLLIEFHLHLEKVDMYHETNAFVD